MAVKKAVVSACLLGIKCAYDGKHRFCPELFSLLSDLELKVYGVCPEFELFGVPRDPLEIRYGDGGDFLKGKAVIINSKGQIFTLENIQSGLKRLESWLQFIKPEVAYLKEKSPFCGVKNIYDGSFSGKLIKGKGIMAALLESMGVELVGVER